MALKFFSNFPSIYYNGMLSKNIILKSAIVKDLLYKIEYFYSYTIKDGERADTIANDYYGDSNYYWLVYFSNIIIDPYYEWPLNAIDFENFIRKKYGSVEFAMDDTRTDNIIHYVYDSTVNPTDEYASYKQNYIMSVDTYNTYYNENAESSEIVGFVPVRYYDYEFKKNENRRNIYLISKAFTNQLEKELANIFKR